MAWFNLGKDGEKSTLSIFYSTSNGVGSNLLQESPNHWMSCISEQWSFLSVLCLFIFCASAETLLCISCTFLFTFTLHLTSLGSENKWTNYYKCNSSLNICLRVHSLIQCISAADYHRWCIWWICWCIASYHFCLFYLHHCRLELIARWCISVTRCTCCNASKVKASLGPH